MYPSESTMRMQPAAEAMAHSIPSNSQKKSPGFAIFDENSNQNARSAPQTGGVPFAVFDENSQQQSQPVAREQSERQFTIFDENAKKGPQPFTIFGEKSEQQKKASGMGFHVYDENAASQPVDTGTKPTTAGFACYRDIEPTNKVDKSGFTVFNDNSNDSSHER